MIVLLQLAASQTAKWDPSMLWYGGSLALALLFFALTIELLRRYFRSDRDDRLSASDQLAQYRSLYEQGTISEEEFNSLRGVLGDELRGSARKLRPDPTPAAPQTTSATTPPPQSNRPTPPPETGIKPA
jgi:hypothetical protein